MITTEKIKVRLDPDDITIDQIVQKMIDDEAGYIRIHVLDFVLSKLVEEVVRKIPDRYNIKFKYIILKDLVRSELPSYRSEIPNYILNNSKKIIDNCVEHCRIVHEDEVIRFLCRNWFIGGVPKQRFKQLYRG